ncbi:MAG TPA: hypothetical protein VGO96_20075 [Pyrinomonadaceae bacterium]|jgi:hypothetical protein|nr:hypothetical protein [Pyrinomonadaceae bacterium]
MAIRKQNTQRTDARLLLESDEPVELPPAEIEESAVIVQFENVKPFVPELLETLRAGTVAKLVPVMLDGSTFAIHTRTRTFWVKLWHANNSEGELTRIERAQVLSCLPSTRGLHVIVGDEDEDDFDDDEFDGEEFDEDDGDEDDGDDEGGAPVNPQPAT